MRRSRTGIPPTRRQVLVLLGGSFAVGGAVSSGGFSNVSGDRGTQISVASDSNAYLGLENFKTGIVYDEPSEVRVTNQTGGALTGTNQVESATGKLKFREPGKPATKSNPLQLSNLADGSTGRFEIVTANDQTGEVTDTVTLTYAEPGRLRIEVTRDITVKFKAGAQLVYAVNDNPKADIRVYDAVNNNLSDPPQTTAADVVGANAADIVSDGNADIPYAAQKDKRQVYATDVGAATDTAIQKGKKPQLKKKKTRLALRPWPPASLSGNLILAADKNSSRIVGVDADGNTEIIANPGNGCGGVAGVKDIDGDGDLEMVFVDGSQQIRYLEQDGTTVKVQNGGVGSNNSTGFGAPAEFPGGPSRPEIPFIDGSQNVALVTHDGTKTVLNSNGVAKKAAVAPVDIDGDGLLEFMFLGNSSGQIKYIDDVRAGNSVRTLQVNGSPVTPLEKVGLNSGT